MERMLQSLSNTMGNRIQSRIAGFDSEYIPVFDWPVGYENQPRYRYKVFGAFLPSEFK